MNYVLFTLATIQSILLLISISDFILEKRSKTPLSKLINQHIKTPLIPIALISIFIAIII